jgi:hypothetical protein
VTRIAMARDTSMTSCRVSTLPALQCPSVTSSLSEYAIDNVVMHAYSDRQEWRTRLSAYPAM